MTTVDAILLIALLILVCAVFAIDRRIDSLAADLNVDRKISNGSIEYAYARISALNDKLNERDTPKAVAWSGGSLPFSSAGRGSPEKVGAGARKTTKKKVKRG